MKEHRPPAPAIEQKEKTQRGEQVAQRVALLQNAGDQAAKPRRNLLHRQRRAHAPLAAHADSEERAQDQERPVAGRECGGDLDHGIEHEIDHERQAPAIAVGEKPEKKCADGPENQRHRDGERHLRVGAWNSLPMAVRQ